MADEVVPVKIEITGAGEKKLDDIIARLEKLEVTIEKGDKAFKKIGETAVGVFGGNLITGAFNKVTAAAGQLFDLFITDGISAASEAEENFNKLAVALGNAGNFSEKAFQGLKDFASGLQNTTKFSDDAIISAASLLESLTRLDAEGLKGATTAAANLSAALGIDLETAVRAVGKAANGETGQLQKMGIEIRKGANDTETFANALAVLNSRFGGTAAAQLNTFAGATARLQNIFNDLQEAVGGVITQNPVFVAVINSLGDVFKDLEKFVKANSKEIGEAFSKALLAAVDIIKVSIPVVEFFINLFVRIKDVFDSFVISLSSTSAAIAQAINGDFRQAIETMKTGNADAEKSFQEAFGEGKVSLDAVSEAADRVGNSAHEAFQKAQNGATATTVTVKNLSGALKELPSEIQALADEGDKLILKLTGEDRAAKFLEQQNQIDAAVLRAPEKEAEANIAREQLRADFDAKQIADLQARNDAIKTINDANAQAEIDANNAKINTILAAETSNSTKILELKAKQAQKEREMRRADEQAFADGLGNLASLQKTGSKELFEIGKAAAIASAIINTHLAVTKALAEGGPFLGPFLAVTLGIKGAVEVANIAATHLAKGIDFVPGLGSKDNFPALLAPGERVVPSKTNEDLTQFLANNARTEELLALIAERSGGGSGSIVVNVGDKEIINVVNDGLRSGRVLAV